MSRSIQTQKVIPVAKIYNLLRATSMSKFSEASLQVNIRLPIIVKRAIMINKYSFLKVMQLILIISSHMMIMLALDFAVNYIFAQDTNKLTRIPNLTTKIR